jgi:O-methyltransferase
MRRQRLLERLRGTCLPSSSTSITYVPDYQIQAFHHSGYLMRTLSSRSLQQQYADLLKRAVIGILALDDTKYTAFVGNGRPMNDAEFKEAIHQGAGFLPAAETLLGWTRLTQLEEAIQTIVKECIPGEILAAGLWKGGSLVLLRGLLNIYRQKRRKLVGADSFQGLPVATHPLDRAMVIDRADELAVSVEYVQSLLRRYGLAENVELIKGWFCDTLPHLSDRRWCLIHVDADFYESTSDVLRNCYPSLAEGGFLIVDDYGSWAACRAAVKEFRRQYGIKEPIVKVDHTAIYWRKGK